MDNNNFCVQCCSDKRHSCKIRKLWTTEEKINLYKGLIKYGRGKWKVIQREFLPTRTTIQIANHCRVFFQPKDKTETRKQLPTGKFVWHTYVIGQ